MLIADRFPCSKEKLLREYATYKFDHNVNDIFQHCKGDIVKFWCTLKVEGYPELSSVAFSILAMSPENSTCERAFSVIKVGYGFGLGFWTLDKHPMGNM